MFDADLDFFEIVQGVSVTVNGDRYRAMLNEFLCTKIEEKDIVNIWFQENGTPDATHDVWDAVKNKCYN